MSSEFKIGKISVGANNPIVFIAEIGSNHCGDLDRAKYLCLLARQCGADIAKFQHYRADKLCARDGFAGLDLAHYTGSPYEVFKKYEVPWEWTPILKEYCDSIGIEFMSTPYDLEAVDHLEPYVDAYKIGSGDITYTELIQKCASKGKPIILSCGASTLKDVERAFGCVDKDIVMGVLQCNTNYTNDYVNNSDSLNLSFIQYLGAEYCNIVPGISDHTTALWVIAAAVGLGAKIIERHFTDNIHNEAPDSPFAMDTYGYSQMVQMVRHLERAMNGGGIKRVEKNEKETVVLQRRAIRLAGPRNRGSILCSSDLVYLRPCPSGAIPPYRMDEVIGRTLNKDMAAGECILEVDLES